MVRLHDALRASGKYPHDPNYRVQGQRLPLEALMWPRVDRSAGLGGCWPWTGVIDRHGYGILRRYQDGHHWHLMAHRVVFEYIAGPITPGLDLDHLCRNRRCVNPSHLEPVDRQTNVDRGRKAKQTYCLRGHLMAEAEISVDRRGILRRRCRACDRERRSRAA